MATRGALIIFEGLDRTGKSTQARVLTQNLISNGVPAELQAFPDRTSPIGKVINDYLNNAQDVDDRVIHLLFAANRWERKASMLNKLQSGISLIVDRYSFSGVAFSSAKQGMSLEWCRAPEIGLLKPDLVIFLTAKPELLAGREGYGEERYENKEFQLRVAARYSELEDSSWIKLDALGSTHEISQKLLTIVEEKRKHLSPNIGELWVE